MVVALTAANVPPPSALYLNLGIWTEAAVLVTVLAFVIQYTWYAPWWRDPLGRTIVIKDLCLVAAIAPMLVLRWLLQNDPGWLTFFRWLSLAMVAAIAPVMIWRMVVWRKIHRKGRP